MRYPAVDSSAGLARGHSLGVVLLVTGLMVSSACTETRRSLGEGCLKDEDCTSGICSGQQCAAAPPLLDTEAPFQDAATDAVTPAGDAGDADAAGDG
jgi:hypothetical protein